jgi:hypothetical protein
MRDPRNEHLGVRYISREIFVQQCILWSLLRFGHTSISLSSCVIFYEYEIRTLMTLL